MSDWQRCVTLAGRQLIEWQREQRAARLAQQMGWLSGVPQSNRSTYLYLESLVNVSPWPSSNISACHPFVTPGVRWVAGVGVLCVGGRWCRWVGAGVSCGRCIVWVSWSRCVSCGRCVAGMLCVVGESWYRCVVWVSWCRWVSCGRCGVWQRPLLTLIDY